jgi:hypothetical protein
MNQTSTLVPMDEHAYFKPLSDIDIAAWNALPLVEKLAKLRAAVGKGIQQVGPSEPLQT